ncbi:MAG TPA: cytochrome P450 [Acidimicrobiales bacterium]|nr:cytochrome P450 [Acidimicrobiales bacterium]
MGATAPQPAGIYDPDWYLGDEVHTTFARLRREDPVHWQDIDGQAGYWAVLRHADVVHVSRHPELFSSWEGSVVLEDLEPDRLELMRHMLLVMDPPGHTAYRKPLAPHFGARVVGLMEGQVRDLCREILAGAAERGEVDLVRDVAAPLPARIIAGIMGLPPGDAPRIQRWAEAMVAGQDEEVSGEDPGVASIEMAMYGIELAATRRAAATAGPAEPADVTDLLLSTRFEDGEPMSDVDFGSFFVQLVTAGNDTTKAMMSAGVHELMRHPDQVAALRDDPGLVPDAVEEMLRYCNPLHYFRRTATADTELGGRRIRAGDKVALVYTSANRDETVFADPQAFDVRRSPNPHVSFGIGTHFCLGAHLARLEARVFVEELLAAFAAIEPAGEPARVRSNLANAYKRLPVRLVA